MELILQALKFVLILYYCLAIHIIICMVLTSGLIWSALLLCRLLGITWVDGTVKGFLNREKK